MPGPTLDEQLKAMVRWSRRAPSVLGTLSMVIAVGYVGFVVAEFARVTGSSHAEPLFGGYEEPALIATPVVGAAVGLASAVLRWRAPQGWLGLLLNVVFGSALLIVCRLAAGIAKVDH